MHSKSVAQTEAYLWNVESISIQMLSDGRVQIYVNGDCSDEAVYFIGPLKPQET